MLSFFNYRRIKEWLTIIDNYVYDIEMSGPRPGRDNNEDYGRRTIIRAFLARRDNTLRWRTRPPPARLGARHGRIPGDFWLVYWPTPVIDLVRLSPRGVPTAPPPSLSPPSQIQREDYHPLSLPPSQPEGLLGSVQMVYACANSLCMRELSVMVANKRLYVYIRGLMMKIYVHMYMQNVFIPLDNFACVSVCHVEYMNIHSSSTRLLISFKVIHPLTLKWPGTD